MYEEMTYENILEDMLSRVTSDVDKREGSIIYDALAPCAYHLAENYFLLNNFIDLVSGDTAVGEYLDRVVADYGIARKKATKAVRLITTSGNIEIGTRWGLSDTTYVVTENIETNIYKAMCEQPGDIGNYYTGKMENIDNVNGVTANLTDILNSGQEEETDDNLRARFYSRLQTPSTSGNNDNYIQWALEVPGVGNAKVFPLWNGNGTVKVLIINNNLDIDNTLKHAVYDYIESVRPIGVALTVDSPKEKIIQINANVILDGSRTFEYVQNAFTNAIRDYLKELVFESYSVSYAKIGSILLATEGVADYKNLLVNNETSNVGILDTEIPIVGSIVLMGEV